MVSLPAILAIALSRLWIAFTINTATFLRAVAVIALRTPFFTFVAAEAGLTQAFTIDR